MENIGVVLAAEFDIDGSPMAECREVTIAEGITVRYFTEHGENKPREIVLRVDNHDCVEMNYSDELAELISRANDVSAIEFLTTCYANRWTSKVGVA